MLGQTLVTYWKKIYLNRGWNFNIIAISYILNKKSLGSLFVLVYTIR